ncbi:hypothetical protein [Halioxenophilus aromaticivorans]|uniref:Uncharacterized protein n=1 Tax=Halioxenophilus aromaticivorans TaxID=1306992 RepID=A0AAV3TYR5_9ALTE
MSDTTFQIVFRGDIAIGQPIEQVKARMGQLFKLSSPQVEKLFTGNVVVLKRGLTQVKAAQYKQAFAKTGAIVSVVADDQAGQKAKPAGTSKSGEELSIAPVGASLMPRGGKPNEAAVAPSVEHLSLRPSGGNLLDSGELCAAEPTPVMVANWGLAELGAIIESISEEALPLPIMDAGWNLAEVGADMGQATQDQPALVAAPALDIAPVGSDLAEPAPELPIVEPDTSHLSLEQS